jgi:hypothetical protein
MTNITNMLITMADQPMLNKLTRIKSLITKTQITKKMINTTRETVIRMMVEILEIKTSIRNLIMVKCMANLTMRIDLTHMSVKLTLHKLKTN